VYYTARPDGDGYAESATSDVGETDTINRTLFYSTKFQADPDTAGDWTQYTTQPADNATFATAKAALLAGLNDTDATAETRGTLPLSLKMVRTVTTAATDLLLDTYTGAAAAYSVRKLDKDYTGYCMKVRRASDDAEADIGFDGSGDLDTAAIATHCGASAGYVSVWYDMSGNSINATQATASAQPQIYNGTAVITENGQPALQWDGTNTFLRNSTLQTSGAHTLVSVNKYTQEVNENALYDSDTSPQTIAYINSTNKWIIQYGGTFSTAYTADTNQHLLTFIIDGSSTVMYEDGTSIATGNPGTNNMSGLTIGATRSASVPWNGTMQEMILWDADQSTNRTGIESDINTYFSIYTP
jgi:hypothetical protein